MNYPLILLTTLLLIICGNVSCSPRRATPAEQSAAAAVTSEWLVDKYGAIEDPVVQDYFSTLVKRLNNSVEKLHVVEVDEDSTSNGNWQTIVLNTDEPNAFSLGAGRICVTRGLIEKTPWEATLAAILAHEMAHELLGHNAEAIAYAEADSQTPSFKFDLDTELAADEASVRILEAAGYEPTAAVAAISLVYRPIDEEVSTKDQAWRDQRASLVYQLAQAPPGELPSKVQSRNFYRMRRKLAGYSEF